MDEQEASKLATQNSPETMRVWLCFYNSIIDDVKRCDHIARNKIWNMSCGWYWIGRANS